MVPALVVAALDWRAVAADDKRAEYFFKPAVMVLLIGAAAIFWSRGASDNQAIFTILALGFSLAGDVFLMQERDMFLQGLVAFFAAHICYILAFGLSRPYFAIDNYLIVLLALIGGALYLRFLKGMREKGQTALAVPVALYVIAISMVVYAAWTFGDRIAGQFGSVEILRSFSSEPHGAIWHLSPRNTATIGAVLFMGSDALIGWTRFVRPIRWAPVAIIVTYHLAQVFLVLALLR
ncbi:MAG: hypothetical protein QOG54_891 [Actinomycetota bacterium]|nr:hypothetical protein [Actinomycetota bacterium]